MHKKFLRAVLFCGSLTSTALAGGQACAMFADDLASEVSRCKQGTYKQPVPGHYRVAKQDRNDQMELMSDVLPRYQSQQRLDRSRCDRCTAIEEQLRASAKATQAAEAKAKSDAEEAELRKQLMKAQIAALGKK